VQVLEKHADFFRDFRGDTVHPSTLELLGELGLLDEFLKRPHDEVRKLTGRVANEQIVIADMSHLPVQSRFVALMPQWEFLDFLAQEARRYPTFSLRMEAEAVDLVRESSRIVGVRLSSGEEIRATLTIAADGRSSILRDKAELPRKDLGAPIDVLWFRLPKEKTTANETGGTFGAGAMIVEIDRGDYWQCAYVVPKGAAEAIKAKGIDAFRKEVAHAAAELAPVVGTLKDWDQVKLLSVSLDRLTCWWRPGLLAIGDAAHAMSPVGGVGINLAVQDAVAAASLLAGPLRRRGAVTPTRLAAVRARRILPTVLVQSLQRILHRNLVVPIVEGRRMGPPKPVLALLRRVPQVSLVPAYLIGVGLRPEHAPDFARQRPEDSA
jgi:2-polyprenyl-6-methoxyphenol hydroxylase-like FAD-dependent oxidoreductase